MKHKFSIAFSVALVLSMLLATGVLAYVGTQPKEGAPGDTITIFGGNDANSNPGYLPGEIVTVAITGPSNPAVPLETNNCLQVTVGADGSWSCTVTLYADPALAVGNYEYTATGLSSGELESGTFTDGSAKIYPYPVATVSFTLDFTEYKVDTCTGDAYRTGTGIVVGPNTFYNLGIGGDHGASLTASEDALTPNGYVFVRWHLPDGSYDTARTICVPAFTSTDDFYAEYGPAAIDLTVTKTATASYTRTFPWTITKTSDAVNDLVKTAGSATVNWTVAVKKQDAVDTDWAVAGTITVHNPNTFDVNGVSLSDATSGGTCTVTPATVDVAAGADATADYVCTFDKNPSSGTNTATATWPDIGSTNASGTGTADYTFGEPTNLVNDEIDVTDTNGGSWHFTDTGSITYPVTYNDPAGACTPHTNVATITQTGDSSSKTVKVCVGADLTVSKDAKPSFTRTFGWIIEKSADSDLIKTAGSAKVNWTVKVTKDLGTDSAWAVSGNIHVVNPNNWEAITFNAADAVLGGNCTVTGGTGVVLAVSASVDLPYTCTFAAKPDYNTDLTNTATATWGSAASYTPDGSAHGTAKFQFTTPTKLVNDAIDVTDTNGGSWNFTDSGSETYLVTYNDPAGTCTKHTNVATITQTGQTADKTVKVCVGADLKVTKDATPTFIRTYNWDLSKAVDKTLVEQFGGTATFNYTVKAWETGFTDSNWTIYGTITVTNPNDWEPITFNASDAVPGGDCTVAGDTLALAANASVNLAYSCTFAAQPAYNTDLTNTATATWDKAAYFTPDGSASGDATFQFTAPTTTVNKTVTITDTFNGTTTTLGTVTATDAEPYASATFTYSHTVNVPTWNCVSYPNTAKVIGDSAIVLVQKSQTVEVCGPAKTGALTMGYWQNKNGQAIITGQAKTGVCPSATWLRQYAPFQDLSATATCAQVATYVTNIIKAANASGSSMNAMLKAQMLSTALDVYFSDPALGGNKIGAPAPIGGVTIDLTKICKMSDSSDGSGTCGGTLQNASGAFGGATSLTVSQILAYAASQSNAGGSVWYAQVKATQELAKNTFDAINNQKAFAP